jgi:hypothetical protein
LPRLARTAKYALWKTYGYSGLRWPTDSQQHATVLITYYNPARMKYIEPQIRNILKCDFVEKLIISNHNPEVRIENLIKSRDKRLVVINQEIKRGCGFRWNVAADFDPEFLIVIDDDVWLFPWQLANLFKHLVKEPEIPHGLAGFLALDDNQFEYHDRENISVDFLCEVYAITKDHLCRYRELERMVAELGDISQMIESAVDFMVISQTGSKKPMIHNTGNIFRSPTFKTPGVAVHQENGFGEQMLAARQAINAIIKT